MMIWKSVQRVGKQIRFDLDKKQLPIGEADGTGVPTRGNRKRGKEMKVFVQLKRGGGVQGAGLPSATARDSGRSCLPRCAKT